MTKLQRRCFEVSLILLYIMIAIFVADKLCGV